MAYPFSYIPRLPPGRHAVTLTDIAEFAQPFETTYVNAAGVLVTVPPNTPRFEKGELLIERASSNVFASPDNLAAALWHKPDFSLPGMASNLLPDNIEPVAMAGDWSMGAGMVRVGPIVGPSRVSDGVIYENAAAGADGLRISLTLQAGTRYKFAVWARITSGAGPSEGALVQLTQAGGALASVMFSSIVLVGGWFRYFLQATPTVTGAHVLEIGSGWGSNARIAFSQPRLVLTQGLADTADLSVNDPRVTTPDGGNGALKLARGSLRMSQLLALPTGTNYAPSVWVLYPAGADTQISIGDSFSSISHPVAASAQWQRLFLGVFTKTANYERIFIDCPGSAAPLWLWWPQMEPGYPVLAGADADLQEFGGSWSFIGPNIARVGTALSPEGLDDAVVYRSGTQGNSFIGCKVSLEPLITYRFTVWTRLVTGAAPAHRSCLIVDSSNDIDPAFSNNIRPDVVAARPAPEWAQQVMTFTTSQSIRESFAYMAVDWETDAHIAFWRPMLTRISGVAPTSIVRDKRGNDVAYLAEFVARYTPGMAPLRRSHEADDVEAELKALFIDLFDTFVRPGERMINTVGIPHIGEFSQVERAVSAEGLSLQRSGDTSTMRYVFRAWRARNPKRGLHMLRTYLQLLWPNGWEMKQQWSKNGQPYTTALSDTDDGSSFLTSRVQVFINTGSSDGSDVASIAPSLRTVVPARIVLSVQVITRNQIDAGLAIAGVGSTFQSFTGSII